MNEKINALLQDEAFVKAAFSAENEEAVQTLFADKGVTLSVEEIRALGDAIEQASGGELSDDALEQTAGGMMFKIPIELPADNIIAPDPTIPIVREPLKPFVSVPTNILPEQRRTW